MLPFLNKYDVRRKKQMKEMNGKYEIIAKMTTGTGFDAVLGQKESSSYGNEYVTWIKNSRGYDQGHYFNDLQDARLDLIERSAYCFDLDLESQYFEQFALEEIENALRCSHTSYEVQKLLENSEFMSLAYHEYMKMDEEVDLALVEMLNELEPEKYLKKENSEQSFSKEYDDYEIEM